MEISKTQRRWAAGARLGAALLLLTLAVSCTAKVDSRWLDREIVIDGADADWQGAKLNIEDANVDFGVFNDQRYLYLVLSSMDRSIQTQMMRMGFTIWFDPEGRKKKVLGVRFPVGASERGGGMQPRNRGAGAGPDPKRFEEMVREILARGEMEIFTGGEEYGRRMPIAAAGELGLKARYSAGRLVYELRLPLLHGPKAPYALGVYPGDQIGVGFETVEFDREQLRRQRGGFGGGFGGGLGGGRGFGGGRGSGGGGGRGPAGGDRGRRPGGGGIPDPFKFWIKLRLSASPH